MMDMRRLQQMRQSLGDDAVPRGAFTPLSACIHTAKLHRELLASGDDLRSAWALALSELGGLAEELDADSDARALVEQIVALLAAADPDGEGLEEVPDFIIQQLESFEPAFAEIDFEAALSQVRTRRRQDELWESTAAAVPDDEAMGGYWMTAADVALSWRLGMKSEDACRAALDELASRFAALERDYEDTWLTADEWTVEVALADELLSAGLREWQDGLQRLVEHCAQRLWEPARDDMADLREANRKLMMVRHLSESCS